MNIRMNSELTDDPKLLFENNKRGCLHCLRPKQRQKGAGQRILDKKKMEIKENVWRGNIVSRRLYDETAELSECFICSNKQKPTRSGH